MKGAPPVAEEYKSSKTRQVMNLINAKPSGVNPFLPPAEQEREKRSLAESTVEDKLRNYTQSKRGTKDNPFLINSKLTQSITRCSISPRTMSRSRRLKA